MHTAVTHFRCDGKHGVEHARSYSHSQQWLSFDDIKHLCWADGSDRPAVCKLEIFFFFGGVGGWSGDWIEKIQQQIQSKNGFNMSLQTEALQKKKEPSTLYT